MPLRQLLKGQAEFAAEGGHLPSLFAAALVNLAGDAVREFGERGLYAQQLAEVFNVVTDCGLDGTHRVPP
ncbi:MULTISPECIES: hypothetical protein [Streptomyces]|uniref:hypothetical protein n=1 Tax=Streptomyces TaxID=1883 RepID=UPI00142E292E|nr:MULTISPECIES: hypothetical protein [Streptomyces]